MFTSKDSGVLVYWFNQDNEIMDEYMRRRDSTMMTLAQHQLGEKLHPFEKMF